MIIEKFEEQTKKFPQKPAVVTGSSALTYHRLNQCANRVAHTILKIKPGNEKNQIAGLLFEHCTQMIVGLIGTLKAGKIYLPLDITYPENRLVYMLEDTEASLIITNNNNLSLAKTLAEKVKNNITIIDVDAISYDHNLPGENVQQNLPGDKLAYILYTSGSTGRPKGVMQTHENVWYYIRNWTQQFSISSTDRMTLFSSFSHDGAGQDIFGALVNGATLYPYNIPGANVAQLSQWLTRERITIWHSVPTLFRYFVNTLIDSDTAKAGLPDLRFILLGGEQIRHHDIEMFKRFFPKSLLANVYGQTESSVSSIWMIKPGDSIKKILIGDPLDNTKILIVDNSGAVVENMGVGEIIVACKHIAPGYWKDKQNSEKKFLHHPELGRLYRAGDLGHLMVDGSIEIMGRRDFQVKIRGHRVEIGEIETSLLNHEAIKEAVVTAKMEENGNACLCAYYVPDPLASNRGNQLPLTVTGLRKYLSRELPEYMVPSYFTPLEKLPLTPNGKVDRKNLPEPEPLQARVNDTYTAPKTLTEKKISNIWEEILNLEKLGIHNNFFELGGDSLKAMTCVGRIHKEFNTEIPLLEIFNNPTIKELAGYIEKNSRVGKFHFIKPAEQKEYYEVSAAQKRLYILQRLEPASTGYNLTFTVLLEGDIDREKFHNTFAKLINRHEILRTSFEMAAEKPVQRIHDDPAFEIQFFDLTSGERRQTTEDRPDTHLSSEFIRPFDLGQSPLMRIGLIKTTGARHIFTLDIHHIIFDGTSINILFKELLDLYRGKELSALQLQYKDYWEWQNRREDKGIRKRQEDYWMNVFAGEAPVINLPFDFPRPPVQSFEGNRHRFVIGKKETGFLKAVAKEEEVTLFMVLLAVINLLLMKLSGQEDMVIGTPMSGRRHPDSEKIVGMFINTLVLRNNPANKKIFREFLGDIKEQTLNAFENQGYPFEDLVEKVEVRRDVSRNPLFDVMFILHNYSSPAGGVQELEIEGLKLKPYGSDSNTSLFDMTFNGVEFDETLLFNVEYCTKLFKKETIERFIGYFHKIISSCREVLDKKLSDIDILPQEEKNQLLHRFNNTDIPYPGDKTIHELFVEQVERAPDYTALVGVHETHEKNHNMSHLSHMSYKELNEKSNQLAFKLKEKGLQPGTIVAIMVDRTPGLMVGLLGILKARGTYLPLDPEYPEARIKYIIEKSSASILLTQENLIDKYQSIHFAGEVIDILDEGLYRRTSARKEKMSSLDPAYVIYTSGSTGNPKGVAITHRNAVNFIVGMTAVVDFSPHKTILAITTISFDIFFLETLLPITCGLKVVIATESQQRDPQLLKEVIVSHYVNMLQFTPSRLQLLLSLSDDLACLEGVEGLIVGGEAFPVHLFEQVEEKFPGNIYNVYGPTETTIWSTIKDLTRCKTGELTIGSPIANTRVYIVDRHSRIQPLGVSGELLIGGDGVAAGYLNNPDLTNEKFLRMLHGPGGGFSKEPPGRRRQRVYRTGDLARWLTNGEIEFLGRIDFQIKIRGFRIEVEEIEEQLVKHEDIKEAVVTALEDQQSSRYLVAYLVPGLVMDGKEFDVSHLREYLQQQLPDYMIPSIFVRLEQIPLTHNGKVDRKRLPEPETVRVEGSSSYQAPRNPAEKKLVEIWSEVLGIDKNTIGIDDNFFERGGHSLRAIVMITKIHKEFDVMLLLADVFKAPSIRGISVYLEDSVQEKYAAIEPAEAKDCYPVSSAQKRLYILHQLDPNSLGYNLSGVFVIEGHIDERRLQNTIRQLFERHENLRTSFKMEGGEPVQKIHESIKVEFSIEYYQTVEEIHHSFIRPFDLSRAPLLRVGLIKDEKNGPLLLIDMHHIITDGTSRDLLVKEFTALYSDQDLSGLRLQYKDYAEWQNSRRQRRLLEHQKSYWRELFPDAPPVLNLPFDYPRPTIQSFKGSVVEFRLTAEELKGLKSLAKETKATLFISILALFNVLLSKLGGQEDIVVGTPAASRRHADLEHIIGIFINTLAMRNYPSEHKTFKEFLKEVKKHALDAYENQEYPFEDLVEQVVVNRDLSRNPLFDAIFILHNELQPRAGAIPEPARKDLKLKSYKYEKRTSQFDLTLVGYEGENHLFFKIEYCTKLFKEESIRRFINYFKEIVFLALKNPEIKLFEIEIIPAEEKNQVLYEFNYTGTAYPKDKTLHELFREQVERTPDHVALVGVHEKHEKNHNMSHMSYMSYKELNEKAHQLAFKLKEKGVKFGTIAAIMVNRTIRMMVGLLGILKAGGAYLPLDPEYPEARIKYIIEKSGTSILVTQKDLIDTYKDMVFAGEMIDIFDEQLYSEILSECIDNRARQSSPMAPAYVIYTSGSTGNPKGVVVQHKNVVNFITGMTSVIDFLPAKSILALTTISFDIFFLETLLPVTRGMKVVMTDESQQKDPQLLEKVILHQQVNMLQLTPSRLQLLLSFKNNLQYISNVAELIVGGETFPVHLFEQVREKFAGKIYNVYGPTETTIWSTIKDLTRCKTGELTIGSPIANTRVTIVDRHNRLQPLGVAGELLIGGDGVASGYLNNVELTAERFRRAVISHLSLAIENPGSVNGHSSSVMSSSQRLSKFTNDQCPMTNDRSPHYPIYHTGDLARWLTNGEIECLGRIDHQVKIRGFRVELEEIEEQLVNHRDIKEAVVATKVNSNNDKYLAAYIVPKAAGNEKGPDIESLTRYLSQRLPHYMIPSHFVPMETIPLTPNGKIQRSALPEPGKTSIKTGMTYVEPVTEEEKIIAGIWKEVLGLETIGVNDNFFNLGGNSLDVVRVNQRLQSAFARDIPVVSQFRFRTVAAFTQYLNQEGEGVPRRDRSKTLNRGERDKRKRFQMRRRRV